MTSPTTSSSSLPSRAISADSSSTSASDSPASTRVEYSLPIRTSRMAAFRRPVIDVVVSAGVLNASSSHKPRGRSSADGAQPAAQQRGHLLRLVLDHLLDLALPLVAGQHVGPRAREGRRRDDRVQLGQPLLLQCRLHVLEVLELGRAERLAL